MFAAEVGAPFEQTQFDRTETDLRPIRNDRFMVLRKKRLDEPGPDQQAGYAEHQRHQVPRNLAQPGSKRRSTTPADQRAAQNQAGLSRDENGRYFERAVRQQPANEKFRLAGEQIIRRDCPENHAVVKQHDDGANAPRHSQRQRKNGNLRVVRH